MARSPLSGMTKKPTVIVPACGQSRRFKEAGIMLPKGLIRFSMPLVGQPEFQTMIEHVLAHDWVDTWETVIVVRKEDVALFEMHLPSRYHIHGIASSAGQADTIRQCISNLGLNGRPILVVNSDNQILYPLHAICQIDGFASVSLVVPGEDDTAYSYVENFPLFLRAAEKEPISKWALAGAFYFPEAINLFHAVVRQMTNCQPHANEYYLSGALGEMQVGLDNLAVAMPKSMLRSWGTPEDLARDPRVQISDKAINKLLEPYR